MFEKDDGAFLTISEVSARFGIAAHILRYWETKFARLRPLQRAGNRRYYRPEDIAMVDQINRLLNEQGYTVSGAAKLLSKRNPAVSDTADARNAHNQITAQSAADPARAMQSSAAPYQDVRAIDYAAAIRKIRNRLSDALAAAG